MSYIAIETRTFTHNKSGLFLGLAVATCTMPLPPPQRFVRRSAHSQSQHPNDQGRTNTSISGLLHPSSVQVIFDRARYNRQIGEDLQREYIAQRHDSNLEWSILGDVAWMMIDISTHERPNIVPAHERPSIVRRRQALCQIFLEQTEPPDCNLMSIPDTNEY